MLLKLQPNFVNDPHFFVGLSSRYHKSDKSFLFHFTWLPVLSCIHKNIWQMISHCSPQSWHTIPENTITQSIYQLYFPSTKYQLYGISWRIGTYCLASHALFLRNCVTFYWLVSHAIILTHMRIFLQGANTGCYSKIVSHLLVQQTIDHRLDIFGGSLNVWLS